MSKPESSMLNAIIIVGITFLVFTAVVAAFKPTATAEKFTDCGATCSL